MVKGRLKSMGIHVQWRRVPASMHRVDSLGILSRLTGLGEELTLSGGPFHCGMSTLTTNLSGQYCTVQIIHYLFILLKIKFADTDRSQSISMLP